MPSLNDNQCYADPPKRPVITVPDDLRVDWVAHFHELLATQLKLDNTEKNQEFYDYKADSNVVGTEKEAFINEFNKHAGPKSTYTFKSQLLESLRKLYCIYTHPDTNADQQFLMAYRIHEDITQCSPGFNDRVNFLLVLFDMPQNLNELLAKARFHLVDKIARDFAEKNAQGVHVHSRFFVIAEVFGYGVSAINENDTYLYTGSGDKSDDDIEKVLAEGFKNRFGLFGIVNALCEPIEDVMVSQGYNRRNEQGYENGVYSKLIELVKPFIAIKNETELLEMDEDTLTKVIDINWQHIRSELFIKLIEEGYVSLSPEEATVFANLPTITDHQGLKRLIANDHELAQCLEYFSEWTIAQKTVLVIAYLKDKTPKEQEAILSILDDQAPQLTKQLKSQPNLQQLYYTIAIQKKDIATVKSHIEKGADINAALGLLLSDDHKSDTLYWLHENKEILAAIHADGMKATILNGKYKDKAVVEALVSTKKGRQLLLENPDLQKLVPSNDWLYQAQEDKKKVVTIEGFFKKSDPLALQLGQYIAYGNMEKAEELLKANPTRLEKLFTEKVSGIKDYSRVKHKGTAFQLALSAMDDEMCEMLTKYMDKNAIADQYQEVFPEGHEKYYAEQKSFDFTDMVDVITNSDDADLQKALDLELPNNTGLWQKLEKFRTDFTDRSKQETMWNPQHLIKALELYDQKFDNWNWKQRDLFWRQVVGYVQRFMPANIAMDVAQGLYYRVEEKEPAKRSFKLRYGTNSIFPLTFDSLSGLGYEYAWVERGRGWGVWPWRRELLQNLCQTKTSHCRNLCGNLKKQQLM